MVKMKLGDLFAACERADLKHVSGGGQRDIATFRSFFKLDLDHESKWLGASRFKQGHPVGFPAPDFWKESTYDKCMTWELDLEKHVLRVEFENGDMMYGEPDGRGAYAAWTFDITHADELFEVLLHDRVLTGLLNRAARVHDERRNRAELRAIDLVYQEFFTPHVAGTLVIK